MGENGSSNNAPNGSSKWKMPLLVFFKDARLVFKLDGVSREILGIAFPSALAVAADPLASLIDTAFIGRLGPVELAAAGVSIALFNQASRITIFPLVSITTSFVAEEDTIEKINNAKASDKLKLTITDELNDVVCPDDDHTFLHDDVEKGKATIIAENNNNNNMESTEEEESLAGIGNSGSSKELTSSEGSATDSASSENVEKHAIVNIEANNNNEHAIKLDVFLADTDSKRCKNSWSSMITSGNKKQSSNKEKVEKKKRHIASASTALLLGTILGLFQAAILILAAKPLLGVMGLKHDSPMLKPAETYLKLRSFGAPAVLLSLAMQGIFRGFKDTTTPLYVIVSGYALNVVLDPVLIFVLKMGIRGAAIAHVLSQYMMALTLLLILMKKVYLLPPRMKDLQIFRFLKNGGLLLARVVAVTFCVTLAASLATRLGSIPMAAFQTCQQVWLTSSLLADGLAVAVQAILACSFAEKDYKKATASATRTLQMGFVLGVGLSLAVGVGLYFGAGIFSKNVHVVHLIRIGIPFVAATQPINSLAFVFDGVNYGASDFAYSAYSLVIVSLVSVGTEFLLYRTKHFVGIWIALAIYMTLRMFAGIWRMGTGTGPWRFLRGHY